MSITTMELDKEAIIALWLSKGKPVFELSQGENCVDLEKVFNGEYLPRYVESIQKWYERNK